jgi:proteasome lid subunit RPN8/RPN11
MILCLQPQHLQLLKEEAKKAHPIEACASLFGKMTQREAIVERVVVASTRLSSTTRFEMDPEAFVTAYTEAERDGLEFVGLFHSHPAPAKPSAVDLESMKRWGSAIWLIQSSEDGQLAAYHLQNDKVRKMAIKVAEGHSY